MIKMTRAVAAVAAALAGLSVCGPSVFGLSVLGGIAHADSPTPKVTMQNETPRVTVVGEGRVSAAPDIMRLNAGVEGRRPTAAEAFSAARAAAARLTKALLEQGIEAKDLQTNDLSLGPEFEVHSRISGYRATQGVQAVVRDVATADKVIEAVATVGEEVRLNGISFELSNRRDALTVARERAFEDASKKARQYARLAGRELGRVVTVSEETGGPSRPMLMSAEFASDKASVSAGRETVAVTARVVFELR
ncbi:SIMPL domain-containing protein [Sinosporangium siamense]|uniref:DUF541 domain-containing protein n=1 Tax=Sinosporangium siamense TaxID=1367973 RepID=A0A919RA72_9ACTN|nr:SIMPL domain-containing protein [Sinosporangium siamense]GII90178.1 hypothetical protein Ssi02_04090 [Sinosporangium siamense]